MSKRISFIVALTILAVIVVACAPAPTPVPPTVAAKPITFGVILVGPYNDHGWSEAHYTAAQYVKSKLPGADFIYLDKLNPADRPGTTLETSRQRYEIQGSQTRLDHLGRFSDRYTHRRAEIPGYDVHQRLGRSRVERGQEL
jgi:hypothetical protein